MRMRWSWTYILCLVGVVLSYGLAHGVDGISGSKLVLPSSGIVERGRLEVEPFFQFTTVDDAADTEGGEGGIRITFGAAEGLEVGGIFGATFTSNDADEDDTSARDVGLGAKYEFLGESGPYPSVALQAGLTVPTRSGPDSRWVGELGLIATRNFTDRFSADADVVFFADDEDEWGLGADLGFGYFVIPLLQPVLEFNFTYEDLDVMDPRRLGLRLGFTSPVTEFLEIVAGTTVDLIADDTDSEINYSVAFTFLF